MNICRYQAMPKLKLKELTKFKNVMRCICPFKKLWDAYECPFKVSSLNHKSIFAKKGVMWYLFTIFSYNFLQQIAGIYPKRPDIIYKYFY